MGNNTLLHQSYAQIIIILFLGSSSVTLFFMELGTVTTTIIISSYLLGLKFTELSPAFSVYVGLRGTKYM